MASFFRGKFLLHIPCRLHFSVGSFSYISDAGFFFLFLSLEFLLHIPSRFLFYKGSFFYTSSAGFFLCVCVCVWVTSLVCSLLWRQPLKKRAGWKMAQKKMWKSHTQSRVGTLQHHIQSRTKPNKNWVTNGHRKERGRQEMNPSFEQALDEKAKNWMDPSSTNDSEDNH